MTTTGRHNHTRIQQWLVAALTLSLLLIPATCASATGPHSIFVDPLAHQAQLQHHQHHAESQDLDIATMSDEAVLLHLAFEYQTSTPRTIDEADDPCESAPKLRDLPSSMAMAALSMPAMITNFTLLDIPAVGAPEPGNSPDQFGISAIPENPPPKN